MGMGRWNFTEFAQTYPAAIDPRFLGGGGGIGEQKMKVARPHGITRAC